MFAAEMIIVMVADFESLLKSNLPPLNFRFIFCNKLSQIIKNQIYFLILYRHLFSDLFKFRLKIFMCHEHFTHFGKQAHDANVSSMARSLFNTEDNISTPCSVNAMGK